MNTVVADVVGQKFNHLTVLRRLPRDIGSKSRLVKVVARCECGVEKEYFLSNLKVGNTKSCGCQKAARGDGNLHPKEYRAWLNMRQCCLNESGGHFPQYGGRGITICERWLAFPNFLADLGECPDGLTLGRHDVDGGYAPGNAEWMDRKSIALSRRTGLKYRSEQKEL